MDVAVMLWGVLFSSIGLGYFIYGKKVSNLVIRYCGLALILLPFFVQSSTGLILLSLVLMLLPRFI